jgi:hypothetical protein
MAAFAEVPVGVARGVWSRGARLLATFMQDTINPKSVVCNQVGVPPDVRLFGALVSVLPGFVMQRRMPPAFEFVMQGGLFKTWNYWLPIVSDAAGAVYVGEPDFGRVNPVRVACTIEAVAAATMTIEPAEGPRATRGNQQYIHRVAA